MAPRTFRLLEKMDGLKASINGATQIRAGVVRPEIIVPVEAHERVSEDVLEDGSLEIGTQVRVIREPYFGKFGRVTALPISLQQLETEAEVRIVEVELEDCVQITLPRANVEIIKGS